VTVVTIGEYPQVRWDGPVCVYERPCLQQIYTHRSAEINDLLARSQALYEGIASASEEAPFDIIDVPLWAGQGLIPTLRAQPVPVVIWLQTTTAQLLRLRGSEATTTEQFILQFEQLCLDQASGILSDSQIALHAIAQDYRIPQSRSVGVATLGIPIGQEPPNRIERKMVEALVVGRLERRKGTDLLLFEILPQLLRQNPQLRIRLIGRDNSQHDGWYRAHRKTYAEAFRHAHANLVDRVSFEGYLSEAELANAYRQADLMLVPSLYESFGLIYLEAMRAALPIISFDTGSTSEIFPHGEADGALIVPNRDTASFAAAIHQLIEQPSQRAMIGQQGYQRFLAQFTATHMAEATLAHYQAVIAAQSAKPLMAKVIYQTMEALDVGDAVSNITRGHAERMQRLGQPTEILTRFAHEHVRHETAPLQKVLQTEQSGLIFHYWNYNSTTWLLSAMRGPKAIYYHNITPPTCFSPDSPSYQLSLAGYQQLKSIINNFDLIIGDSQYNIDELGQLLQKPLPSIVIYPVAAQQHPAYDQQLLRQLTERNEVHIVFIGRIAPNKRQDRLIQLFDYYYRMINRHAHLWLVGNSCGHSEYMDRLMRMQQKSIAADRIHFTGKVSEAEMHSYYRAATVFVCASDHEGFCVPIVEAMSYDIPVIAYAAAAVPETMGNSGILFGDWDIEQIAEMINQLIRHQSLRERIIAAQRQNLQRFTDEQAYERLRTALLFLGEQRIDPLLTMIYPQHSDEKRFR
jgi:glycosyltransferase involved in cell wall biosynthesis